MISPVRVLALTPHLAACLEGDASSVLSSNSCDLESMRTTCFAAENCGSGVRMRLADMLRHDLAFVAVADEEEGMRFVGCVSCMYGGNDVGVRKFFSERECPPHCFVVYNLCVSSQHRNAGIASLLMQKVQSLCDDCLLMVRRDTSDPCSSDRRRFLAQRSSNLKSMYEHMRFEKVGETRDCFLMRWRRNRMRRRRR